MSREAWGDPPDPERVLCPDCGNTQHTKGCEACDLDKARIAAIDQAALRDALLPIERKCCGTFQNSGHRVTCPLKEKTPNVIWANPTPPTRFGPYRRHTGRTPVMGGHIKPCRRGQQNGDAK